jgi:hypothetical protein
MTRWTVDQVVGLAPDDGSVSAGRKLAAGAGWIEEGCDERVVWGVAQGSGKSPYQVAIDLKGPAYKCSCPSLKIPCKHVIALLLRWVEGTTVEAGPSAFAAEWLSSREERAQASAERSAERAESRADPAGRAKRAAAREERIDGGLDELERWLVDLLRSGLVAARGQSMALWDRAAARLVDAQAPGLAGRVRAIAGHVHSGEEWPSRVLAEAARLHLAIEAWRRRGELSDDLNASLRAALGWPVAGEEVRAGVTVRDGWLVLGSVSGTEDRLIFRRTWLRGIETGRAALVLQFSPRGGTFEGEYAVGRVAEGELCFYPGAVPLRALPKHELRPDPAPAGVPRGADVALLLDEWSAAIAGDPWLERWPVTLEATPVRAGDDWWLRDASGAALPIVTSDPWRLVAVAGGRPVTVAGEYGEDGVVPLTVFTESGPVRM